jgi:predicted glycosyltransferase
MVYSHDAYGLGNLRRMLAICTHLLAELPDLSILLISGSPLLHSFRLPQGLDYIKLPCLNRGLFGNLSAKYLRTDTEETVNLRSQLILSAAINFKPDLFLIDKKPYGINNELAEALNFLQVKMPHVKRVLLLRDILDRSDRTITEWQQHDYYQAIQSLYDLVLVVGSPDVFNLTQEYRFPLPAAQKVRFCGYIRKPSGDRSRAEIRQQLQVQAHDRLVVVTPGGGEDGYSLIDAYLAGLKLRSQTSCKSLIICGPEMSLPQQEELRYRAALLPNVQIIEFTDDLMSYLDAADVVVSMAGYNTTCEILSLNKRAVVVPRHKPSEEQLIRADRLAKRGLLAMVHPDRLSPALLMHAVRNQLAQPQAADPANSIDLNGLPRINHYIRSLLFNRATVSSSTGLSHSSVAVI